MKGFIQVFQAVNGEDLLVEEGHNMILDNWSETIADVMTRNPAVSATQYSALLDCSNYTVRAISYSKSPSGFANNCHSDNPIVVSGRTQGSLTLYAVNSNSTSSYSAVNNIPSYPHPNDILLQELPSSLSSVMVTYGQNLNLIVLFSSVSSLSSIGLSGALQLGCYGPSGAGTNRILAHMYTGGSSFICSGRLGPNSTETLGFNAAGAAGNMDWRGFQRTTNAGATSQGLVTSSNVLTDPFFSTGQHIRYRFLISARQMDCAALYGGIQSVGLWTIDIERTLANGVVPPFQFSQTDPKIEYKLLAKKVFLRNLCYIEDVGTTAGFNNHNNLTGDWLVYFA